MSLINEALKKAQNERQPGGNAKQAAAEAAAAAILSSQPEKPRRRKRNYLWGFIISVLVVGLLASGVSLILVNQLVKEEEAYRQQPAPQAQAAVPVPETAAQTPAADAAPAQAQDSAETATLAGRAETVSAPMADSVPPVNTPVSPVAMDEPAAAPVADSRTSSTRPAPEARANPEVWARLEEFEIRGIMPGGSKVLIFDKRTSQSQTFRTGDMLDGTLGIRLGNLSPNQIEVEDYGGYTYTKSF